MRWTGRLGAAGALVAMAGVLTTAAPTVAGCVVARAHPVVAVRPPPAAVPGEAADVAGAVAAAMAVPATRMTLGLAVLDLRTGRISGSGGDRPFFSASVAKLIVAVDVLGEDVTAADRERVRKSLSDSDDEAMNALWSLHDGPGAVARVSRAAGLTGTRAPSDPAEWGETVVTADDLVRLHHHIQGTPAAAFVAAALSAAPDTAADGADQAFGLNGPGLAAYGKQGWMTYRPNALHLHSVGVVGDRYAVALLSIQRGVPDRAARDTLTAIAAALATALR